VVYRRMPEAAAVLRPRLGNRYSHQFKEKGPLRKKSPLTRKEKGGQ